MRRSHFIFFLFLLVPMTAWVLSLASRQVLTREFGELSSSQIMPHHIELQQHFINLSPRTLKVLRKDSDKEVFSIDFYSGFINAGSKSYLSQETRGSFRFDFSDLDLCQHQTLDQAIADGSQLQLRGKLICNKSIVLWTMSLREDPHRNLQIVVDTQPKMRRLLLKWKRLDNEKYFGTGAQFTHLQLNEHSIPIWVSEQGIGRGLQPLTFFLNLFAFSGGTPFTTYLSSTSFISSDSRGVLWNTKDYSELDLTHAEEIIVDSFSDKLTLTALGERNPKQLLSKLTIYTGKMKSLPDWFHKGAILGIQGGSRVVLEKMKSLRAEGAPISGLWLQDWVGQRKTAIGKQLWWNWSLNENHYEDWQSLRSRFAKDDIKTLAYINPMLTPPPPEHSVDYYTQAKKRGFFVKDQSNQDLRVKITSFDANLLDLSNPEAVEWLKSVVKSEIVQNGFSGWMADFGEALPTNALIANGLANRFHNRYAEVWAKINREVIEEYPEKELLAFHRSGFTTSPKFATLFWTGDQLTGWDRQDGLHSALIGILSSGLSGFALNHSDVGGYTSIQPPIVRQMRSKELLLRWMEMNTFSPVFRTHEGNLPDASLQVYSDSETAKAFSYWAKQFADLFEYRKQVIKDAAEQGWPAVRPLWFEHPSCGLCYEIDDQFFFGDRYLVAPVLRPGVRSRRVTYPTVPGRDSIQRKPAKSTQATAGSKQRLRLENLLYF
jgi:alpha-glucosidase